MTAALAWRAIPLTIFCAGYGNVAMEVLRRGSPKITGPGGVFTPHLRLVANFFRVRFFFPFVPVSCAFLYFFVFFFFFFFVFFCTFFFLVFLLFLLNTIFCSLYICILRVIFCIIFFVCSVCVFRAGPWFVMCWLGELPGSAVY